MLLTLILVAGVGILLWNPAAGAEGGAPERLTDAKPGDCMACHAGGKQVLPKTHPDTKAMTMEQCMACHDKDEVSLKSKMPTGHTHMLSGVSCQACHGKEADAERVSTKTCTACHPTEGLSKTPGKGVFLPNPHTSHYGTEVDCDLCHRQHGKSEFMCADCHDFKNVTPSPLVPLSFPASSAAGKPQASSGGSSAEGSGVEERGVSAKGGEAEGSSAVSAKAAAPEAASALSVPECISCHSGLKYTGHFEQTGHRALSCTACHRGVGDLTLHMQSKEKPELASCASCHKDIDSQYGTSLHAAMNLSCLQCHSSIHPQDTEASAEGKAEAAAVCLKCHSDRDKYADKGHTARVMAGNTDAASCTDCHGAHDTMIFDKTDEGQAKKRAYYTALCTTCHAEGGTAGSYGVFPRAAESFGLTYHGKAMKLGEPDKVAGCTDCHQAHNILPPDDPASALSTEALVETCGKCHENFHPRFVSYVPHPDPHDKDGFYSLYLTEKFMIALLAGVFGFFWVHSLLWWRKVYAEKSRLVKAGLQVRTDLPEELAGQYVRRFGMKERIMHIVLIVSFFGVVISGFPLKYSDAPWAGWLTGLMGGVANAALVHRISAAAMCLLFLYVCWLSLRFLFPGFQVKGWLGRLFGPDSLFPRVKDFQDCLGMFKWFFNAGDKPRFDRWTYWEKFDFMAVFWGMFVIGLSGVIMWIPEYASWVMPGWMINIVHLAHSEEAFLAAVFIFTIHFFNNHLVPDKFPLEKNIFTGSYTLAALKHERPLEYERILAENRLEEIKTDGPNTASQLFAAAFGLTSLLLGLTITILIFWAVLAG
jgi:cytochrome b subunit of formate dehydrogenase